MTIKQNHPQLEQALPSEVSIQSDTWLNRYRNYPVFSRTWFKFRTISFGIATLAFIVFLVSITLISSEDTFSFLVYGLVPYIVSLILLFLLGQSLAVWVKSQNYTAKKEAILITCAIVFGMAGSIGAGIGTHYTVAAIYPQEVKALEQRSEKRAEEKKEREKQQAKKNNDAGNKTIAQDNQFIKESVTPVIMWILSTLPMMLIIFYQGSGFDLYTFFRQRKRLAESLRLQELKQAHEARREAELRLSVLVAQVEPHFLFNTLAGVRSAILTDPLRATVIVDHLVDYLRSTIPNMRDDGTTNQGRLAQQLEAAKSYLGLMKARIPRLSFEVTSDIKDAAIPPLILISLVENAIKHGIEPKIGPAHIEVTAKIIDQDDDKFLEISVIDNGVGFGGTTSGGGIGLSNIRERLESTYGKHASLTLKAQPESGVNATIILPLAM
jgi:signal transduction histidine kinase